MGNRSRIYSTMAGVGIWNSKLFLSLTIVLGLTIIGFPSASAQIINGDFEDGLTGWTSPGTNVASTITTLGPAGAFTPILPPQGSSMAFLNTAGTTPTSGFGIAGATGGSVITQTFIIPINADTLDFCYQFVSNDAPGFENFFAARLDTSSGIFWLATADNAGGSPAGGGAAPPPPAVSAGVTLTPATAPIFLSGVNILSPAGLFFLIPSSLMTSLVCSSFDIPTSIKGTSVTLDFIASDLFDFFFDSAVIIDLVEITLVPSGGGPNEPPTIGKNLAGDQQIITNGICIDAQCWTVTQNFHVDFELVEMLTSPHTISNTIYCSKGVDTCNHITLSAGPYQEDINAAIWKVSLDKSFLGELTVTKDDPDGYLGDTTCTAQIIEEKYWGTSCTIDFKKPTPGMMLGVQVWDDYGGVRNFYFNDGIEVIDTYGYPSVDTEFEHSLDVPRLCLSDDPDKRTSCAFAEKVQLEIERAEKLLT